MINKHKTGLVVASPRSTPVDPRKNLLRRVFKGTGFGLLIGLGMSAATYPAGQDFPTPSWYQLRFEASNLFAKASAEISLEPVPPDTQLIQAPKGQPIIPDVGSIVVATAEIRAKMPFKRKHWTGQVWFDPETGSGFQRVRTKLGDDANRKGYRFGREGVYRSVFRKRESDEVARGTEATEKAKHLYFPHPIPRPGCDIISDPLLLLIEASGASRNGHANKRVCVFNKKTLYHVDLTAEDRNELQIHYDLTTSNGRSTRRGSVTATKVRLAARRVDPQAPRYEDFEFLGLEGEISVLVDDATGLPVGIEGDLSGLGQVRFMLTAVTLNP